MNHQEVVELLPWYVNATIDAQERELVDAHLKQCPECAQALAEAAAIKTAVANQQSPEPSPFQFTRALARVEEYEREKRSRRWWSPIPAPLRIALAAQFVLILALGVGLWRQQGGFTTAVGPTAGPKIVIGFQPGVSEETVRQLIQEIRGEIVSGPSALGLYTIRTPEPEVDKLIANLQRNQKVIRVAALAP